jgi:hypothetical protein
VQANTKIVLLKQNSPFEKIRTMVGVHMDYMLPLGIVSPSGSPLPTSSLAPHHSVLQSSGEPWYLSVRNQLYVVHLTSCVHNLCAVHSTGIGPVQTHHESTRRSSEQVCSPST